MPSTHRTLIDFATGENWEMPLALYEKYYRDCIQLQFQVPKGHTCIEYWFTTLTEEEQLLIIKR
jgi:RecB family endonuclease NucS